MKKHVLIRFIIFFILFAGAVEAKPVKEDEKDNALTVFGAFNTFTASGCSTTDKYVQGSVGVKYDRKFNKSVKGHVTAIYSRATRVHHKQEPPEENEEPEDFEKLSDGGAGGIGITYMNNYFSVRSDMLLHFQKESYKTRSDEITIMPFPALLLEAGKLDFMWITTGFYHHEYPMGRIQVALNGKIGPVILGGGGIWDPGSFATVIGYGTAADFSLFLRTHAEITDIFAIKAMFNVKPQLETWMMFEGSLGMEFHF